MPARAAWTFGIGAARHDRLLPVDTPCGAGRIDVRRAAGRIVGTAVGTIAAGAGQACLTGLGGKCEGQQEHGNQGADGHGGSLFGDRVNLWIIHRQRLQHAAAAEAAAAGDNPGMPDAPAHVPSDAATAEKTLLLRLAAGPVSGDALAREAGLTRAAVWKRIQALRAAGIGIGATPGRGYALDAPLDLLDAAAIMAALPADVRARIHGPWIAWSIDSTNSELMRRRTPASGVDVLLAERQTGGRGRLGRAWSSPLAANLYLSLACAFDGGLARLGGLALVAGVAVAEALHALGHGAVRLKWPNDLVVADAEGGGLRKLGGLLVEGGGEQGGPVRAVLGIGLNVRMPVAAGDAITQPWCDLAGLAADPPPGRSMIAAALLAHLVPALDLFDREGLAPFLPRYAALDALEGREVQLVSGRSMATGIARGLAGDGALRVDVEGGERCFHAGEASLRAHPVVA